MSQREYEEEKQAIKESIIEKIRQYFGCEIEEALPIQLYKACAMTVRDMIMDKWSFYRDICMEQDVKEVYYLSVEYLTGRFLETNLINLSMDKTFKEACAEIGIDLPQIAEMELEPGLGNGGLGRLAACFLDSLSSLGLPGHGYGIRYQYGLFEQRILDGSQVEVPDPWLSQENVWEVERPEEAEEIKFGGKVVSEVKDGRLTFSHQDFFSVMAVPFDIPMVGYKSQCVNTLRLWSARPKRYLDFNAFNQGQYIKAVEEKNLAEVISSILYPEDSHYEGKALRLKQHYFFISASVQSIISDYKKKYKDLVRFPERVAIHINDTHPALAIPELMRILMDEERMDWDDAWDITVRTMAYTNHTTMEESLEKWPISLFQQLLPRIYMIIQEINEKFCKCLWEKYPGQWERISEMAVVAYGQIRMANLAIVGSHSINGVAELHGRILKTQIFPLFYQYTPEKFTSITNGVVHRRWLLKANPGLAELITAKIGDSWIMEPERLKDLSQYCGDEEFTERFKVIRKKNKEGLAQYIKHHNGIEVNVDSIFDVQVKRLHEYKRQLLNILRIMYLYNRLKDNPGENMFPRTFIFGAKASPGYYRAKEIIYLINCLAHKINNDKDIGDRLKVVFLENYNITLAEKVIPAADINEQISTASKEASGTGNMKFMLNGSLIVGTLDGANAEIGEAVGPDNIFIFGLKADQVINYYKFGGYNPLDIYNYNHCLRKALDQLVNGFLDSSNPQRFQEIYNSLLYGGDTYFVLKDFKEYISIQQKVENEYRDGQKWWSKAAVNVSAAGRFSSDRSILEYNEKIWRLK